MVRSYVLARIRRGGAIRNRAENQNREEEYREFVYRGKLVGTVTGRWIDTAESRNAVVADHCGASSD